MKKVGILSMQRIYNYGSFLQAYGLKKILEDLGCNVEFVDYRLGECLMEVKGGSGLSRKFSKAIEVFQGGAPLKEKLRFIKYKKNYAANYYPYLGINENMNYTPDLDLLVIGSDEVFNCVQDNTNVGFSPELFGYGNRAKRLISYAASFGNTTVDKLEKYNVKDKVSAWLNSFDSISVRDANSKVVIEALTGKTPTYNLDPVLAYDFMGKCKQIPISVPESDYLLLYGYSGRFSKEECKEIRKYAKQNGLKIFCIGGVQDCCDKFIDCDPFRVIAYFKNADCVITDTFHGTILSVITHQRFVTFVRNCGYGNSEKLTDLLERLGLKDRICNDINLLAEINDNSVDYRYTDDVIGSERKRTYDYLSKAIMSC